MKYLHLWFGFTLLLLVYSCKTKPSAPPVSAPFDPVVIEHMWKAIDSLEKKGLLSSALEEVRRVRQMALSNASSENLVKVVVYENRYLIQLEEDSAIKALARAEEDLLIFPEPAKSILHSLAAQWYTQYLETHLWELRQRTEYAGSAGPDVRTWGIRHFTDKINEHYTRSVQWNGLTSSAVGDYLTILTDAKGTDELRPTLYDILMHRALDYLSGRESYLTSPSYGFVLTDPAAFASAREFIVHEFSTQDSLHAHWQALQWYQQLLAFRLSDSAHEAARIDADLKRLRFVHEHGVMDAKDSIYEVALTHMNSVYVHHPESALIEYYRAELKVQQAARWSPEGNAGFRFGYRDARALCQNAIARFPDAYGAQLCKNLIAQIDQKAVTAAVESVNLPGEPVLARLEYRNVDKLFFRIIRLPEAPRRWRGDQWDGDNVLRRLNSLPVSLEWEQLLEDGHDHQLHSTEMGLPAFSFGHYALVVSDSKDFDPSRSTTGTVMFTVSELAYWVLDDRDQKPVAAIIHRGSGQPLQGVKVEFYTSSYNPAKRRQEEIKLGEILSDEEGWAPLPMEPSKSVSLRLTRGEDELFLDESHYGWRSGSNTKSNPTTLFFTDRSIYRPGQKIFFKGYALVFDENRIPAIVANQKIEMILYDANGQEISKQPFMSNAYGTFSGHFDLPGGGMTGQMSMASSHGSNRHFFRVEEYKRPKFEVTFDTLKEVSRLGEMVTVTGLAKDYAGSPVIGAEATYRVERVSYIPWWWGYRKSIWPVGEDRQVLASGKAFTASDGRVPIAFRAVPKPGGDPDMMYRFEVTLYITDITGESHEASKSIVLNQQGFSVHINLAERVALQDLGAIPIQARNGDHAEIEVKGQIEVSQLTGPTHHKRERLWPAPDMPILTEAEYAEKFNSYFYPGKEAMDRWPVGMTMGRQEMAIDGQGMGDLTSIITKPGYYKLDWTWADAAGKPLRISQHIMVYAPDRPLPGQELIQVHVKDQPYSPGQTVPFQLLTGLSDSHHVIQVVERRTQASARTWMTLPAYKSEEISISEEDRGGVYVHHLAVYNNRFSKSQNYLRVPWSQKDLQVSLTTWRDKMEPGADEEWTLHVSGEQKEKVNAELLLSMYDASLDAFVPHQWQMHLYPSTSPKMIIRDMPPQAVPYWALTYHWDQRIQDVPWRQYRDINSFGYYPEGGYYGGPYRGGRYRGESDVVAMQAPDGMQPPAAEKVAGESNLDLEEQSETQEQKTSSATTNPPLRSALEETVFFYPQMNTDAEGNLTFSFKMKEGLTRWKFQALAHTKDLAFGIVQAEAVTQKDLMVFPNPPRFFREGDTIGFQIKVTNMTAQSLQGGARLKILNALTDEDITKAWLHTSSDLTFSLDVLGSSALSWTLRVPDGWVQPVKYQVSASAGSHSDGEEALLPVVTNRILITETLPLPMKADETRTFVFRSMLENRSPTSADQQYVVEMTTSPAWYAVQALPYLMEYPHECAEQVFSRLYANSLATHIAHQNPAIRKVYDGWRSAQDDALLSNLEKNQDLKSALLEETPWVRDAMGETRQKKNIALLFEPNRLRYESRQAMERLGQMQLSNGGFPWFPGGRDNWYITQYIVEGFGHLKKMSVALPEGDGTNILQRAIPYIDARMSEWYEELKRQEAAGKLKRGDHQISSMQIHFLYARSFYPDVAHAANLDEVQNYVREQIEKYWLSHSLYEQGLMALAIHRMWPQAMVPQEILASLRQRTIWHEELGRYWKMNPGYQWYEAPVEMQSLMIELYQDMEVPQPEIDELRVWLLKQKQTTQWRSTKATASAVYALLIHPDTWLQSDGIVEVSLGKTTVIDQASAGQAGTGYIRKTWPGSDIKSDWTSITVTNPNPHIAWGGVYWQYWEDLDQVKKSEEENPLNVTRSLLVAVGTDRGQQTIPVDGRHLKVGDKLIVRLTIETDRNMEFVHLKDLRASGFEPMDVLSGYQWRGGLGYYQSTRDLATHFFIDYLPRGKFVIEYPVTVAQSGAYSEGLATLQCMYAPEFGSHSEGSRVLVKGK